MEHNSYRDPIQTFSHPSPPYEASYDAYNSPQSMYHQGYQPSSQASHGSPYSQAMPAQHLATSAVNTLAQQNSIINQATNGYVAPISSRNSPQQQTTAYDMSTGNQVVMEQQANQQLVNGNTNAYHSPGQPRQAFSQQSPGTAHYGDIPSHRPSCEMVGQPIAQHPIQQQPQAIQQQTQHDPNSPYTQVIHLY